MNSTSKSGFTLVEFLVVFAILAILVAISATAFLYFSSKSDLQNNAQELIEILKSAQNKALSSEGASRYGVYFNNTTPVNQYILFKGASYSQRDVLFDEIHQLPSTIEIYEINLIGGGKETVFNRISGNDDLFGNVKIRLKNDNNSSATIYIENSGQAGLVSSSSPSGAGLLKDTRHIHLDLGWSIQNATLLKLYFPATNSTQIINMAGFFNALKTEFSWDNYSDPTATEVFKIHTHFLDPLAPPYTTLCLHRDRNNGKNTKEVIIYIADGDIDKEVAHYYSDGAVVAGGYVQRLEIQ